METVFKIIFGIVLSATFGVTKVSKRADNGNSFGKCENFNLRGALEMGNFILFGKLKLVGVRMPIRPVSFLHDIGI